MSYPQMYTDGAFKEGRYDTALRPGGSPKDFRFQGWGPLFGNHFVVQGGRIPPLLLLFRSA